MKTTIESDKLSDLYTDLGIAKAEKNLAHEKNKALYLENMNLKTYLAKKRADYAAMAMQGLLSYENDMSYKTAARGAVEAADELIKALNGPEDV